MKRAFEVYLQFDALSEQALRTIRGADLRRVRERALDALDRAGISTTLVCVVKKGVNDGEIGDILRYAQQRPCVRGVTFQPVQDAGRNTGSRAGHATASCCPRSAARSSSNGACSARTT